jgi:hypothetical protein
MTLIDGMRFGAPFVLGNTETAPLCAIAAVGLVALLSSSSARRHLADRKALALALSLFVLWVLLVPYAIVWNGTDDGRRHRPLWAIIPNYAVLLSWPFLAHRLVRRMGDARRPAIIYIACNAPGLLFTWFATTIIVSADWI